jgi:hypothetical protein
MLSRGEKGRTRWRSTAETAIIDVFNVESDEPGSQRNVLIGIFVQNVPEMSPSIYSWSMAGIYVSLVHKRITERKNRGK